MPMLVNAVYDLDQYNLCLKPLIKALNEGNHEVVTSRVNPDKSRPYDFTIGIQAPFAFNGAIGKKVWISHGISCTKGWSPPANIDLYISPGPYWERALALHKKSHPDRKFRVLPTGWSKTDILVNMSSKQKKCKASICSKLSLDVSKPLVAYFPTYRGIKGGQRTYEVQQIIGSLDNKKYNVVAAAHQMEKGKHKAEFSKSSFISGGNKLVLLAAADLLISDTSSVVYEFLAFDRPIVLLDNPEDYRYLHLRHTFSEPKLDMGLVATDLTLADSVAMSLSEPTAFSNRRDFWRNWVLGPTDGMCCSRIVKALEKELVDGRGK